MARIETWLRTDLKQIVSVKELDGDLFTADRGANRVGVIVTENGVNADLTGETIVGYMIRPDEETLIINGSVSENRAWVDLPASAYVFTGPFSLVIKAGDTTIGACHGYVQRSTTDTVVDPGDVIPSLSELLAEVENMRTATAAANTAASNADAKASVAEQSASNADTKAALANAAASNATDKATIADTAATNANAKASLADTAAAKINNMTVAVVQDDDTASPSATLEVINGHYNLTLHNFKGVKGDTGDAFHIVKTYETVALMEADFGGTDTQTGDYVMVVSSVEDPDNAKVYIKGTSGWRFVVDMSGATGIKGDKGDKGDRGLTGATPDISVGTVTTLLPNQPAYVALDQSSTPEAPVYNFGIPKGDTGTVENTYGNTIDMSSTDTTKVSEAIAGKASKVANATSGNFAALDANGNLTDSGRKHSDYLTQHQDISGKADKVTSATSGNFAALDANGNLTDSGHKHSDYLTQHQDISGKADKTGTVLETTLSRGRKESTTVGSESFAFGLNVTASGQTSFAIGNGTTSSAPYACAEGKNTTASGTTSHAKGIGTTASGSYSSAEGYYTTASGSTSHAEGYYTNATHKSQHVIGEFNYNDPSAATASSKGTYVEIIGNGTATHLRSNARALDWDGNEYLKGTLYVNCNSHSEGGSEVSTKNDIAFVETGNTSTHAISEGQYVFWNGTMYTAAVDIAVNDPLSANSFNALQKGGLNDLLDKIGSGGGSSALTPSTAFSIPSSGDSVTYSMEGMTANHQLVRWNFSNSAENNPPASLTWSTADGRFTITNVGGTTDETIQPVFVGVTSVAITAYTEQEGGE